MSLKEKDKVVFKKKKKAAVLVKKKAGDKNKIVTSKNADNKESKVELDDINNNIKQSYNQELEGIHMIFLVFSTKIN